MKSPEKKSAGSSKNSGAKVAATKTLKVESKKSTIVKKTAEVVAEAKGRKPASAGRISKEVAPKPAKTPLKTVSTVSTKASPSAPKPVVEASKPVIALEVEKKNPVVVQRSPGGREAEAAKAVASRPVEAVKAKSPQEEPKVPIGKTAKPAPKVPAKTPERTLNIPPILLEGDLPPMPKVAGPGARYALAVQPPVVPAPASTVEAMTELPEGYGTRRLFLTARDPRWLYASWDLMLEQQREYNLRSRDGHLVLRVYAEAEAKPVVPDVHVNPESRNFFINVLRPETRYWAELGLYTRSGAWEQITKSQSTFTPPEAPSPEPAAVEFATIPLQVTFEQVVKTVQEFVTGHQPLLEAVIAAQEAQKREAGGAGGTHGENGSNVEGFGVAIEARAERAPYLPQAGAPISESVQFPVAEVPKPARRRKTEIPIRVERAQPWTPERREALRRLISIDGYRRVWMGSIEITELVRRQLEEEISSIAAAELAPGAAEAAAGPGAGLLNISSPLGGEMPRRGRKFWFKVNAELIIYGATEPDARVTVAERSVKLRPDGTFSFRFALPDGRYGLPAVAASADGVEAREAILEFSRTTDYHGHVEAHPQDPGLRSPRPENL